MIKVIFEQRVKDSEFDNILLPILTRLLLQIDITYLLSIKWMLDDQMTDAKLQKEVLESIKKKKAEYSYKEVEAVKLALLHAFLLGITRYLYIPGKIEYT